MQLKKQSWNTRSEVNAEGATTDRVTDINYQILDNEGNVIGNANIGNGYANANFNFSGFSTIEEGEEKLKGLFGELND